MFLKYKLNFYYLGDEIQFENNKVLNNFHQLGQSTSKNANSAAVPYVKKKKDNLPKSISDLSINEQLNFQNNETSELLLNEIKSLAQTTTNHASTVIFQITFLQYNAFVVKKCALTLNILFLR